MMALIFMALHYDCVIYNGIYYDWVDYNRGVFCHGCFGKIIVTCFIGVNPLSAPW